MTKEIQKAIDFIHAYMHPVDDSESEKRKLKYRDMAIRSLEAWEKEMPPVKPQESSITWVTGADGAKIAFWDVPVWKVTKICEILGEPQERGGEEWKSKN